MTSKMDKFQEIVNMPWRCTTQGLWEGYLDLPMSFSYKKNEKAATPYQCVEFEEVAFFLYSLGGFDE